jgi:ferrochelatase
MSRTAVVLFNLGGPDSLEAVRPFLFNLFNDPAIIRAPGPVRRLIATLISRRRAPVARQIYAHLGGKSPLLEFTRAQATALEAELGDLAPLKVFIAMRYWHPMSDETARAVAAYGPERVVLLPLYPQFSTTTTASSLADWRRAARGAGLEAPSGALCCYPTQPSLVAATARLVETALAEAQGVGPPRLLFSAHGLPKRVVERGDPYRWQVERTAAAVAQALGRPELDWLVCFQSRVGPLEWIGPATSDEIERAGRDRVPLVVAPIAFVSEHSETLVELDVEYRALAERAGVPAYLRVPALGTDAGFIKALGDLVRGARMGAESRSETGARICPADCGGCPNGAWPNGAGGAGGAGLTS